MKWSEVYWYLCIARCILCMCQTVVGLFAWTLFTFLASFFLDTLSVCTSVAARFRPRRLPLQLRRQRPVLFRRIPQLPNFCRRFLRVFNRQPPHRTVQNGKTKKENRRKAIFLKGSCVFCFIFSSLCAFLQYEFPFLFQCFLQ